MSFRIQCPFCQQTLAIHDRFSGTTVRCPKCEGRMRIPAPPKSAVQRMDEAQKRQSASLIKKVVSAKPSRPTTSRSIKEAEVILEDGSTVKKSIREQRNSHTDEGHDEAWDITPMVDVAFLLLIFFMITASFSLEKVIPTAPEPNRQAASRSASPRPTEEMETIIIQIDEFNCYSILPHDGDRVDTPSRQELTSHLKQIHLMADDIPQKISIQAHEESTHNAIVGALDAAREAEFFRIDFTILEDSP